MKKAEVAIYDGPTKQAVKRKAESLGIKTKKLRNGRLGLKLPKGVYQIMSATTVGKLCSRNLISDQMYRDGLKFREIHRKAWGNVEPKTSLRRGGRLGDMKAHLIGLSMARYRKEAAYIQKQLEEIGEKYIYPFLVATISHDKDYWRFGGPSRGEVERLNKALRMLGYIFKEGYAKTR